MVCSVYGQGGILSDIGPMSWNQAWFIVDLLMVLLECYVVWWWARSEKTADIVVHHPLIEELRGRLTVLEKNLRGAQDAIEQNRDSVSRITDSVKAGQVQTQTMFDSRLDGLLDDTKEIVRAEVGAIKTSLAGQFNVDRERVQEAVDQAIQNATKAKLSKESREHNAELKAIQDEYAASAQREMDAKLIYTSLVGMNVPPGMAETAARWGPVGIEWAMRQAFGDRKADVMLEDMARARDKVLWGK